MRVQQVRRTALDQLTACGRNGNVIVFVHRLEEHATNTNRPKDTINVESKREGRETICSLSLRRCAESTRDLDLANFSDDVGLNVFGHPRSPSA